MSKSSPGHVNNFEQLAGDCERSIRQPGLETTNTDCMHQLLQLHLARGVRGAAAAIPDMTGSEQLICEALHWRYMRLRRAGGRRRDRHPCGGRSNLLRAERKWEWISKSHFTHPCTLNIYYALPCARPPNRSFPDLLFFS